MSVNPWIVQESKTQPVPAGSYYGEFVMPEVGPITLNGQPEDRIRWKWRIFSGPQQGRDATTLTDCQIKTSNKAGRLVAGMVGRPLQPGENLHELLTNLVSKKFLVVVGPGPKGGADSVQSVTPPPSM